MPNEIAPPGFVYVCMACGKRSRDAYGDQRVSYGWDESCMLNCELVAESRLVIRDERVVDILPEEPAPSRADEQPA